LILFISFLGHFLLSIFKKFAVTSAMASPQWAGKKGFLWRSINATLTPLFTALIAASCP